MMPLSGGYEPPRMQRVPGFDPAAVSGRELLAMRHALKALTNVEWDLQAVLDATGCALRPARLSCADPRAGDVVQLRDGSLIVYTGEAGATAVADRAAWESFCRLESAVVVLAGARLPTVPTEGGAA